MTAQISTKSPGCAQRNIGYVPQDVFLFSDTIANNIAFAGAYSQEEIEKAARLAQVYDNIIEFPNKFETMSGERGVTLSGGKSSGFLLPAP